MDPKYFGLFEAVAFAVCAFAFCGYQIWTVRRKSDDDVKPLDPSSEPRESEQHGRRDVK
jgi:hypothetical protein